METSSFSQILLKDSKEIVWTHKVFWGSNIFVNLLKNTSDSLTYKKKIIINNKFKLLIYH